MKLSSLGVGASLLLLSFQGLAQVAEEGDWIIRVGAHHIDPQSNPSTVVDVDSEAFVTFDFTYMVGDHFGVELLAALPFEHDITLTDGTLVGSTKHLPPTLSFQYRFGGDSVQPYIGVGVNYTKFISEQTVGPIAGLDLHLRSSVGLAAQVGIDVPINDRMLFNAVLRKIEIESDAYLNGNYLTKVALDPYAVGINIGWRF